ncbi:hypothetical protein BC835DRAFT_1392543 [Cytidiella melzeri]|nr:hypothetical protein BC835DRAFT_1392543 [Cytidiella melzeri]
MARGGTSPAPSTLPKVKFTKVDDDEFSSQPAGVSDTQARSYGYNDGASFKRPEHYIRYIEPLESDLAQQVEYDMDEQDREWLESVNADRRKEQLDKVSYEVFEIVMDKLEKEYFDLSKTIPKTDLAMPSEDSTCAICDDSEGENTNAIVFCDGCNLAVHQDCYGVPYIPEGQWLCRKCTVSPENPVSCILCPNEGGAFKQTVQGEWVHLLCAIWVPETRVANDVFMEPVTGIDRITKPRWRLKCSLCDVRMGACIQCNKASCTLAFHATCARKEKLLMPMKATQGSEAPVLACYCEKHLPRDQIEARAAALASETGDGMADSDNQKTSKTARAYAKTYKPGPPLVPNIIVNRITQYIGKVNIRQKREFVTLVCKYWSLKREARRGAPLLKRLHLEPWTASAGGRNHSEEEKVVKLQFLKQLKADLDRVRELANLSKKREVQKILQARAVHDVITRTLLSFHASTRAAFGKIVSLDRQGFFKTPVSRADVPDYYDVVERPICWNVIEKKLCNYEYMDLDAFNEDIHLVLSNAMLYNRPDTQYFKAAQKIKSHADKILAELEQIKVPHPEVQALSAGRDGREASLSRPPLGDLEPPLAALQPLLSQASIADDLPVILETDPVTSLMNFEFAKLKPPPTPPPPKPKRDRRAERERARLERIAAGFGPGERARTRRSLADTDGNSALVDSMNDHEEHHEDHTDRHRKKPKVVLPGQAEVPPVVDEVNNQEMFTKFNVGWILPESSRRGGRAPVDRQPLEPKRKKQKTERERSHLSTEGTVTAPEELAGPSGGLHGEPAEVVEDGLTDGGQPMVVNYGNDPSAEPHAFSQEGYGQQLSLPAEPSEARIFMSPLLEETPQDTHAGNRPTADVDVDPRIATQVNGPQGNEEASADVMQTTVIEVLDTPASRREKNMRKKAQRQRLVSLDDDNNHRQGEVAALIAQHYPLSVEMMDVNSDLTSLSSDDEEKGEPDPETEPGVEKKVMSKANTARARMQELGKVELEDDEWLPPGTFVWAKMKTYPWWPAVVQDASVDDGDDAHPSLDVNPEDIERDKLHLVRFFDGKNGEEEDTWQYVPPKSLKMFGTIKELDNEMIATRSKIQKWRNGRIRADTRKSYERAREALEGSVEALQGFGEQSGT